jgi:hypothetical protein
LDVGDNVGEVVGSLVVGVAVVDEAVGACVGVDVVVVAACEVQAASEKAPSLILWIATTARSLLGPGQKQIRVCLLEMVSV